MEWGFPVFHARPISFKLSVWGSNPLGPPGPEFSLLDENLEEPALDFKAGLMAERFDLVGEVLVLLWHGQKTSAATDQATMPARYP